MKETIDTATKLRRHKENRNHGFSKIFEKLKKKAIHTESLLPTVCN